MEIDRKLPPARDRLVALDGLRGAAALMVVVFHFFARWAEPLYSVTLYPHGNLLAYLPALAYFGSYGILLFFLVSGFVIMMTLERSSGVLEFAGRRFARLWPTMLVCATLSTLIINGSGIAFYYPGLARLEVTPLEYVSSIFFLPPNLVSAQLGGGPAQWVEGVYWTLFAEVRFYGLIALLFLLSPRAWFLWVWAALQALSTGFEVIRTIDPSLEGPFFKLLQLLLQPRYLGWFSIGICGYMFWSGRFTVPVSVTAFLAVVAILAREIVTFSGGALALAPDGLNLALLYGAVFTPFALFLRRSRLLRPLECRPLVAIGLASYPLYLFHERAGLVALKYTSEAGLPAWLSVAMVILAIIMIALLIHRIVEMPAKRAVTRLWLPSARALERRFASLRFA